MAWHGLLVGPAACLLYTYLIWPLANIIATATFVFIAAGAGCSRPHVDMDMDMDMDHVCLLNSMAGRFNLIGGIAWA